MKKWNDYKRKNNDKIKQLIYSLKSGDKMFGNFIYTYNC